MEKQKQIYFIVNGTETTIFTDGTESVADLAKTAIIQADNIQRPIDNYQVIHNERTLNWNKPVFEQGVKEEDVIFLSLKAGSGASAYSRERVEAIENEIAGRDKSIKILAQSMKEDEEKIKSLESKLSAMESDLKLINESWNADIEQIKLADEVIRKASAMISTTEPMAIKSFAVWGELNKALIKYRELKGKL